MLRLLYGRRGFQDLTCHSNIIITEVDDWCFKLIQVLRTVDLDES